MSDQNKIQGEGIYAPEVLSFVRAANDFCSWLEDEEDISGTLFIKNSVRYLSGIYSQLVTISYTEPVLEGGNEKYVTEQEWSKIYQKVLNILGSHNSYLRIADGEEFDRSDLVTHTISEDLADIFQDLKDFTLQYRQGIEEIMNDALWEVMDNFDNYWGTKLLNALMALNKLYVNKTDPGEASNSPLDAKEDTNPRYDNSFFTRLQDQNEEDF